MDSFCWFLWPCHSQYAMQSITGSLRIKNVFFLFTAAPVAYGISQAMDRIKAAGAGLHHSHSNTASEPHLWPIPQLDSTRSLIHWERPGMKPASSKRQHWVLDPLSCNGNSQNYIFFCTRRNFRSFRKVDSLWAFSWYRFLHLSLSLISSIPCKLKLEESKLGMR